MAETRLPSDQGAVACSCSLVRSSVRLVHDNQHAWRQAGRSSSHPRVPLGGRSSPRWRSLPFDRLGDKLRQALTVSRDASLGTPERPQTIEVGADLSGKRCTRPRR
jgi:hypothetical protein